jgi:uncharacterized membrane protein YbhN (UPF0104 family)
MDDLKHPSSGEPDPGTQEHKKKKKDGLGTNRGIETMFRTSYRTHVDLSALADNKANIMIGINGIIMSVLIASISPKIDANLWLIVPTTILLIGLLISLIFAILAARPRVTEKHYTLEDIQEDRANILFFGNFVHLSSDEYVESMKTLMQDTDRLYTNMIRDIHGLGTVLRRKFELLRTSYTVFMWSLAIGVLAFVATYLAIGLINPQAVETLF